MMERVDPNSAVSSGVSCRNTKANWRWLLQLQGVLNYQAPVQKNQPNCGNTWGQATFLRSLLGRSTFGVETDAPRSDQGGVDFLMTVKRDGDDIAKSTLLAFLAIDV